MKGIIFDFNGTLFWDDKFHKESFQKYAKEDLGIILSDDDYFANLHGSTNRLIYEYFYKKPIPKELEESFGQKKEQYYREMCYQNRETLTFGTGAYELLAFLKEHNIPHAIATSSEISNVLFYKEIFNINKWFSDDKIIYDDGTVRGKPFPDLFLKASYALNVDIKDLIVIDDAYSGVKAARAAGAGLVVGMAPYGKDKFLGKEFVDLIIEDFTELDKNLFLK